MTTCPQCGALLPENAKACPECGSDEKTGWSDKARFDELGVPDDEFDHDRWVEEEIGGEKVLSRHHPDGGSEHILVSRTKHRYGIYIPRPFGIGWLWWFVALSLVMVMIFGVFRWLF